jgi:hypothetical protein
MVLLGARSGLVAAAAWAAMLWPQPADAACGMQEPCAPAPPQILVQDPGAAPGKARSPARPLHTLRDVDEALRRCWKSPPLEAVETGMDLTILVSFKRNGEIFGVRITHESRPVSPDERKLYHQAVADWRKRCSLLPVSESLGAAIAGRPFTIRIDDTRKQRKAESNG